MTTQEPSKSDVDNILKRLRALSCNKVRISCFFFFYSNSLNISVRQSPDKSGPKCVKGH